jgi:hypothetical protein
MQIRPGLGIAILPFGAILGVVVILLGSQATKAPAVDLQHESIPMAELKLLPPEIGELAPDGVVLVPIDVPTEPADPSSPPTETSHNTRLAGATARDQMSAWWATRTATTALPVRKPTRPWRERKSVTQVEQRCPPSICMSR